MKELFRIKYTIGNESESIGYVTVILDIQPMLGLIVLGILIITIMNIWSVI